MNGLGKNFQNLAHLQGNFEKLIGQVTKTAAPPADFLQQQVPAGLQEVDRFGTNPGNLRMHIYVPARMADKPPLVVALHGCGQNATRCAVGTGWSKLADHLGFVVLYPEQQSANNPKKLLLVVRARRRAPRRRRGALDPPDDAARCRRTRHDRSRVFVTGLSAGGAMANVMLAAYPDTFAAGAIIAGLPYGSATSVQEAISAMFTDQQHAPRALGDLVRAASPTSGPWPRISIWHGTADQVVRPGNADLIASQWADVHGLAVEPSFEGRLGSHAQRRWNSPDGTPLIESLTICSMAHGVPLNTTAGSAAFGIAGPFFTDAGISSTQHIARFWDLGEVSLDRAAATIPAGAPVTAPRPGVPEHSHDPANVIAAAFKAAGLSSSKQAGTHVAIIEAALKAAGIKR